MRRKRAQHPCLERPGQFRTGILSQRPAPPRSSALMDTRRRLSVCQPTESVVLLNQTRGSGSPGGSSSPYETIRLEGCLPAEQQLLSFVSGYPQRGRTMLLYGASGSAFVYLAKLVAKQNPRCEVHYVRMKQFLGRSSGRDYPKELQSLFTPGKGKEKVKMVFLHLLDTIYGNTLAPEETEYAHRFRRELPDYLRRAVSADNEELAVLASARKPWLLQGDLGTLFERWVHVALPGSAERIRLIKANIGQVPCSLSDSNYLQLSHMTEDYTYSEIGNMVEEAHLGPYKRIEAATHFRQVERHWEVCTPADRGAVELSWHTMKPTDVKEPMVYGDLLEGFVKVELRRSDKELAQIEETRKAHPESEKHD